MGNAMTLGQRVVRGLTVPVCCLFLVGAMGCDDEPDFSNNQIQSSADTGGTDEMDTGTEPEDTGATEDTAETDPDTTDSEDADTQESDTQETQDTDLEPIDTNRGDTQGPGVSGECLDVVDLGSLPYGTQDLSFTLNDSNDGLRTSCRDFDAPSRAEQVYKFQVDQLGVMEVDGGSDLTFELRTDPCGEEESVESCNPNGTMSTTLSPGIDYYFIIEPQSGTSTDDVIFDFAIKSPATECGPGQTQCVSDSQVEVCNQLGSYSTESCATSCTNDSCVGDSCQNPIEVSSSASMSGDLAGFSDKLRSYPDCTSASASDAMEGSEVVFYAAGLTNGQTIDVDAAADTIDNTIFIKRGACGATGSCEAFEVSGSQTLNFSVQKPGDYYIIIDSQSTTAGAANYTVTVN